MRINNFGNKLKFEESKSSKLKRENEIFISLISRLEACWDRSTKLIKEFGIIMLDYEEGFFSVIDDLLILKYGVAKAEVILWYLYERKDPEGKISNLIIEFENGEEVEYTIKTPQDLLKFLKTIK